jgi:DNA-directed RNA polymerase specialized sigma subunit
MGNQFSRKEIKWEEDSNGCWNCISHCCNSQGYPHMGLNKKIVLLSRYMYSKYIEEIPQGLIIRHKCDNTKCINPHHLETGTQLDNIKDKVKRNRQARTHAEIYGGIKLTQEQVFQIRADKRYHKYIAKDYNISQSHVSRIKRRESWSLS